MIMKIVQLPSNKTIHSQLGTRNEKNEFMGVITLVKKNYQ